MSPVDLSVVVISKAEAGLGRTLSALEAQVHDVDARGVGAEVVVVDASSGALDSLRLDAPWVRWINFTPVPGKDITIPEQRNAGVAAAQGDVIVYIDAGCEPAPGWLDRLTAPLRGGGESVTCGVTGSLGASIYDAHTPTDDYLYEAATINLAFTRGAFDAVDGFDESFDYCSDTDFSWRLNDAGYRIRLVRDAVVLHDWGSGRRQLRRAWFYGAGRARLYLKHRSQHRWSQLLRRDPILAVYPVFLLGLPAVLNRRARVYPLLLLLPLWRSRRCKPFSTAADHVVYGAGALRELARGGVRR